MWALVSIGLIGVAAVFAACYVARKRRLKQKETPMTPAARIIKIDPTLTSDEQQAIYSSSRAGRSSSDLTRHTPQPQHTTNDPAHTPASAHTVAYSVPYKGRLLDGWAEMREEVVRPSRMRSYSFERRGPAFERARAGLSSYRPVRLQLLAAPEPDGQLGPEAPAWSALIIDGVTVPFDEMVSVKMVESALGLIVEQRPLGYKPPPGPDDPPPYNSSHGQDVPPLKHLRMHSRSEYNLWREALHLKVIAPDLTLQVQPLDSRRTSFARFGSKAAQIKAKRKWHDALHSVLADAEASATSLEVGSAGAENGFEVIDRV